MLYSRLTGLFLLWSSIHAACNYLGSVNETAEMLVASSMKPNHFRSEYALLHPDVPLYGF